MARFILSAFADEAADALDEQISALRAEGIGCVELRGVNGKSCADLSPEEARDVAATLRAAGIPCEVTRRVGEGHPNVHDVLSEGGVSFIINTPHGHDSRGDGAVLRQEAVSRGITNVTTLSAATALLQSLAVLRSDDGLPVHALQDLGRARK